jgi:hypothetical protein
MALAATGCVRRISGAIAILLLSQWPAAAEPQQLDLDLPPMTIAANIQIIVEPSSGAVILFTGIADDRPMRFPGPSSTRMVPTVRPLRVELVDGAQSFKVNILGRIDILSRPKMMSGR